MTGSFNDSSRKGRDRSGRDYTEFGFRELGSDDALDRYLDREITRESAVFRAAFVKREFRTQLDETEAAIGELRRPVRMPDLSANILEAVDARKAFVATRTRRVLTLGRLAVAASVLLAVGGVVLIERTHPGITALHTDPEPISGMVSAASMANHEPITRPTPSVVTGERTAAGSALMNWTIAKLGCVEAVEVRGCAANPATANLASANPKSGRTGPGSASSWASSVRTLAPVPDASPEWAVGFATFPTPDPQGRIWAARGW